MGKTICSTCKSLSEHTARFCGHCGNILSDSVATVSKGPRSSTVTFTPALDFLTPPQHTQEIHTLVGHNMDIIDDNEIDKYVLSSDHDHRENPDITQQPTKPLDLDNGFLPIPGGHIAVPQGNIPAVPSTPHIDGTPQIHPTPQVPGKFAGHGTAGSSAAKSVPSQSSPPPVYSQHSSSSQGSQHPSSTQQTHALKHQSGLAHDSVPHSKQHTHTSNQHHTHHTLPHPSLKKKTRRTGKRHLKLFIGSIAGIVIVSGILIVFFLLFPPQHPTQAALKLEGTVVPGGSLPVHGSGFSAGRGVTLTINGQPASIITNSSPHQATTGSNTQASLSLDTERAVTAPATAVMAIVKTNGTFDVTLQLDPKWAVGSMHTLLATEQSSGQKAQLQIVVPPRPTLTSCPRSTDTITRTLGPVDEGQEQAVTVPFALCTTGSDVVHWTANWNQKQATWLQLTRTGHIIAPLMQALQVGASAKGLKAGIYNTTVTFSSQNSSSKMSLKVTFIVRASNVPECLNTSPQSLSFITTQGQSTPKPKSITITNCGKVSSWTASTSTDDGMKWLNVGPTSGSNLQSKATQNVFITVLSAKLGPGTYTGQVTFTIGSGVATRIAVVDVILTVLPSTTSCISASPQSLSFTTTQGQSNPQPQATTIGNCGSSGSWFASTTTTDGAKWLNINSASGMLNTNATQNIPVTVSSITLQSGKYTGQITFTRGTSSVTIYITVNIIPLHITTPCLNTSDQLLLFTSTQGQGDPSAQAITLTNCGQADSWSSIPATSNGTSWLSIDSSTGNLASGASQAVSISVANGQLGAGTYTGQITFTTKSGATAVVTVQWNLLLPPPCIQASTQSLAFTAIQGEGDPAPQAITLTNCGPTGAWSGTPATSDGANWLSTDTPSGTLNAGAMQDVQVSVSSANLSSTTQYNGQITFTMGASSVTVNITFTVSPPPPPCIQANPSPLNVTIQQNATSPQSQTIVIANCGDRGNWTVATDGSSWLGISGNASGPLDFNATDTTSIAVSSSTQDSYGGQQSLSPGSYQGTITFTITTSTGSNSVTVTVYLTVTLLTPPHMTVNTTSLDFGSVQQGQMPSQNLTLGNTGEQDLNWNADIGGVSWAKLDTNSGTVQGSNGQLQIQVTIDTSQLSAGNHPTTLTLTSSNADNTPLTVTISVVVTLPAAMSLDKTSWPFTYSICATNTPISYSINIKNTGGDTLTWTVSSPTYTLGNSSSWLTVQSDSGSNNGSDTAGASSQLTFYVDPTTLTGGTYIATVDIIPSVGQTQTVTITGSEYCNY